MSTEHNPYPYSDRTVNVEEGWNFQLADVVPAEVREAEAARHQARNQHNEAMTKAGRITADLKRAKDQDGNDLAQALADGKPAPGPGKIAKLEAELVEAQRTVDAFAKARHIVGQRFLATMQAADLHPAVAHYDAEVHTKLALCRDHLTQAKAARDEALAAREISRTLDAFPLASSNYYGRIISNLGGWTVAVHQVESDISTLEDSTPASLLTDPDEQAG